MDPPNKAPDLVDDMRSTGLNHVAFDVGPAIEAEGLDNMKDFLTALNRQVHRGSSRTVHVLCLRLFLMM